MASRTLKAFMKEFKFFDDDITKAVITDWNKETAFVLADAQSMAPLAEGFLARTVSQKNARFSTRGIESVFEFPGSTS